MTNHGTALTTGQLADFLSTGTKALVLIADKLGPEVTHNWARNSEAMQKVFLDALNPSQQPSTLTSVSVSPPANSILVAVKIGAMGPNMNVGKVNATEAKETKDCFTESARYFFRNWDLGNCLPKNQIAGKAGGFSVQQFSQEARFVEIFAEAIGAEPDIQAISKSLIANSQIWNLPQIEDMVKRQEKGEEVGLLTNGYANLFPVLNSRGNVSVVCVRRDGVRWRVGVDGFGDDDSWEVGDRVFIRNSNPSDAVVS